MRYISTWQDEFYVATGMTELIYSIYDSSDDTLLYAGKAVARPDEGYVNINISRIVQNYLNSELPDVAISGQTFNTGAMLLPNAVKSFYLTDSKGNVLETFKYLNCWDYETWFVVMQDAGMSYPLSDRINNHSVLGMFNFTSVYTKTGDGVRVTISYGNNRDITEPPTPSPTGAPETIRCGDGALYYSNSKGGWDSFLIEGNIKKTDSYDKYTINNNWNTNTLESGTRTLVNTITESWQLMTHMLSDNEMKKLAKNLFGSNNIYFHDFISDRIYPVKITDKSVEYKTWKSNKRKKFYATIKIESNQPKQRI